MAVPENHIRESRELGKGAYGTVTLIQKGKAKPVARKTVYWTVQSTEKADRLASFELELSILQRDAVRNSPFLPDLLDYRILEENGRAFLDVDYCNRGNLFEYFHINKSINLIECMFIAYDIISAIKTLHKLNIIHRDVKSTNVLIHHVGGKPYCRAKLADFGIARDGSDNKCSKTDFENLLIYPFTEMGLWVDLHGFGTVLYSMMKSVNFPIRVARIKNQKNPNENMGYEVTHGSTRGPLMSMKTTRDYIELFNPMPRFMPKEYAGYITTCWEAEEKRHTATQIKMLIKNSSVFSRNFSDYSKDQSWSYDKFIFPVLKEFYELFLDLPKNPLNGKIKNKNCSHENLDILYKEIKNYLQAADKPAASEKAIEISQSMKSLMKAFIVLYEKPGFKTLESFKESLAQVKGNQEHNLRLSY